jgi:hypothetical protein
MTDNPAAVSHRRAAVALRRAADSHDKAAQALDAGREQDADDHVKAAKTATEEAAAAQSEEGKSTG